MFLDGIEAKKPISFQKLVMPVAVYLLLGFVGGALLGLLGGLLLGRSKAAPVSDNRLEAELRNQLQQREAELGTVREQISAKSAELATAQTSLEAAQKAFADQRQGISENLAQARQEQAQLCDRLAKIDGELREARTAQADAQARNAVLEKSLTELRQVRGELDQRLIATCNELQAAEKAKSALEEKVTFLQQRLEQERQSIETIQQKFLQEFSSVSNKLLVENASRFNQQSGENLEKLLAPLRENLTEFRTKLDTAQKESSTYTALLKEQINRIGTEAASLSKALKGDIKILGNWGENRLDQILEKSGLQKDIHYRRQVSMKDGEGDQRFLDVVIQLPDNKSLVIDSKVPLRNYEAYVNAPDDVVRLECMEKLVEDLRKHFKDLGGKRYHDLYGINAPDFVLMYVPLESAYFAALAHQSELFAEGLERNVVIITNSTLLATLRTASSVWRLADQQKNAIEIAERGGRLYDKFVNFVQDLEKIGSTLESSHKTWQDAFGKLSRGPGNLLRQSEELKKLGAKAAKALPPQLLDSADPIDQSTLPPEPANPN